MKKSISIILLFVFLFNTVGYVIAFKIIQSKVKAEISSILREPHSSEQLILLIIPDSELKNVQWLDEGKEIRYKGHMYDIVSMRKTETTIAFCCFDDTKEKKLVDTFDKYVDSNSATASSVGEDSDDDKNSKKKILNHITKLYLSNSQTHEFVIESCVNSFYRTNTFYTPAPLETKGFPPEYLSCSI